MSEPGTIPSSNALAEADPASLTEAIQRFDRAIASGHHKSPEARRDLRRIVEELREQRLRFEAAEAAGQGAKRGRGSNLEKKASVSADDLGL